MIMLWVDTVLYMVIAWYVDNINPGDAGVAQPPWFIFKVSNTVDYRLQNAFCEYEPNDFIWVSAL